MEKMLGEADITPTNLSKLGSGIQKLNTTVDKMSEITDVVSATGDYTQKPKRQPKPSVLLALHIITQQIPLLLSIMLQMVRSFFTSRFRF